MKAYLQTKEPDGHGSYCNYLTTELPVKVTDVSRKGQTISGYGTQLPTEYMVKYNNRWQRVKAVCISNVSTYYIGKKYSHLSIISLSE